MAQRIIVTGATGLIGTALIPRLVERGDEVVALVRDPDKGRRGLPSEVRLVTWSASSEGGDWREALEGADGVVHLAGASVSSRWTRKRKRAIRDSRIEGTRRLVEAMGRCERPPAVLVSASGSNYYGVDRERLFVESDPPAQDFLARVTVDWEREAAKAGEAGTRVVIIRAGMVLDPRGGALARMLPTFRLGAGGSFGDGMQPWSWIHIDDLVRLYLWALDNEEVSGPYNAASPNPVTNGEFAAVLGGVLNRPAIFSVPRFVLRLALGEMSMIVTEGQRILPERATEQGFTFEHPHLYEAMTDLVGDGESGRS